MINLCMLICSILRLRLSHTKFVRDRSGPQGPTVRTRTSNLYFLSEPLLNIWICIDETTVNNSLFECFGGPGQLMGLGPKSGPNWRAHGPGPNEPGLNGPGPNGQGLKWAAIYGDAGPNLPGRPT